MFSYYRDEKMFAIQMIKSNSLGRNILIYKQKENSLLSSTKIKH